MQSSDRVSVSEHERARRAQHTERASAALEQLLQRVLEWTFTGTGAVELDVKQGGITLVRVQTKEVV